MSTSFYDGMMEGLEKEASGDMMAAIQETKKPGKDKGVDDVIKKVPQAKRKEYLAQLRKSSTISKEAAGRPMASQVTNNLKATLVVGYNPQNQTSQMFVKRLDKALTQASGLERLKVVVLNPMLDRATIDKLDIPIPGAAVYKGKKKLHSFGGKATAMEIGKYLNENKGTLAS